MTVRMTGMTGLIDTDALVEASLLRYKTKLNTQKQNKMIQEYKQEQYRAIMNQAKDFQNKYLDVLSSNSLFSSSAYNTIKFTSTDSTVVSATGSTKAKPGNYKVIVDSVAKPARRNMASSDFASLSGDITINNRTFRLKEITDPTNLDQIKSRADDLNTKLKNANMGVTVEYSDFANGGTGGIIFQTEETGQNATLSIERGNTITSGTVTPGRNATELYTASVSIGQLDSSIGVAQKSITIDGTVIPLRDDVDDPNTTQSYEQIVLGNLMSDINALGINRDNLRIIPDNGNYTIQIGKPVSDGDLSVSFYDGSTNIDANITGGPATKCTSQAISMSDLGSGTTSKMLVVNGQTINTSFDASASNEDKRDAINRELENKGIQVELIEDNGEYKLYSKQAGASNNFSYGVKSIDSSASGNVIAESVTGTNISGSIEDMDTGERIELHGGNTITLDEVTFKISDVTGPDGIKVIGKQDVTDLKDKIVSFVNDYNKLIGAINTKLYETRDKSYKPLTDEDKEGLTDSQITKLENKAKEGLLRNDDYLRNFADAMKAVMSTIMDSNSSASGYSLEKIGIAAKRDYTSQNGILEIDENKLIAALEEDPDKVKNLLISGYTKSDPDITNNDGILAQLKKKLKEHATESKSILGGIAGYAEGVTATTNELSKDIKERQKAISELEASIKEREDKLYVKYAALESALSKLQSQQSSLASYFGQNN